MEQPMTNPKQITPARTRSITPEALAEIRHAYTEYGVCLETWEAVQPWFQDLLCTAETALAASPAATVAPAQARKCPVCITRAAAPSVTNWPPCKNCIDTVPAPSPPLSSVDDCAGPNDCPACNPAPPAATVAPAQPCRHCVNGRADTELGTIKCPMCQRGQPCEVNAKLVDAAPSLPLAELDRLEALRQIISDPDCNNKIVDTGEYGMHGTRALIYEDGDTAITCYGNAAHLTDSKQLGDYLVALMDAFPSLAATIRAQAERVRELEAAQMTQRCIAIADIPDEKIHRAAKTVEAFMDEVRGRDSALVRLNEGVIYDAIDYIYNFAILRDERNELGKKLRAQAERVRALTEAAEEARIAMENVRDSAYNDEGRCAVCLKVDTEHASGCSIKYNLDALARIQSLVGGAGEKDQGK